MSLATNIDRNIVVLDDDPDMLSLLSLCVRETGYNPVATSSSIEFLNSIDSQTKLVIIDYNLPDLNGLQTLAKLKEVNPDIPAIIVSGEKEISLVIQFIKAGAFWFLSKPFELESLTEMIHEAVSSMQTVIKDVESRFSLENCLMTVQSNIMKELYKKVALIKDIPSAICLHGETGTGKSRLAKIIHKNSKRKDAPFVGINCSAFPSDLLEAELFGVEKGAYTGAIQSRPGYVEYADGGTLFLDEIADLPLNLQPKLLQLLQEKVFRRVGSSKVLKADVRIISVTHQDLHDLCMKKKFRKDLFYRLNVIPLKLPPLRERIEDLPHMIGTILQSIAYERDSKVVSMSNDAVEVLTTHNWPGNIRELENLLQYITAFIEESTITENDILAANVELNNHEQSKQDTLTLAELEKSAIDNALKKTDGNRAKAAKLLGISERGLYSKLKRFSSS